MNSCCFCSWFYYSLVVELVGARALTAGLERSQNWLWRTSFRALRSLVVSLVPTHKPLHNRLVNTLLFLSLAFRRRRHYVFGLSVRLSVRSLKYPLFTCTWVRWSNRPTVTVLRHVRPSVHPERFPGICRRMHGGIGLKFYMLMYLDHLQNWLVYGRGLLIFSCDQAALQMVFSVCPLVVRRSC